MAQKVTYYDDDGIQWSDCEYTAYWDERGKVQITQNGEKEILEATFQMHNMALEAVDLVVNDPVLLTMFNINKNLWPAIKYTWN